MSTLRATVVELPRIAAIACGFVAEAGLDDRVQVIAEDVLQRPPAGSYDVAVFRNLIQVLSRDQARQALRNVGAKIEAGGTIYIVGHVLDDSRLAPANAVGINLVFLSIYDGGQSYTEGRTSRVARRGRLRPGRPGRLDHHRCPQELNPSSAANKANDHKQNDRTHRRGEDFEDDAGSQLNAQTGKQPGCHERAPDTRHEVADQAKSGTAHDLAGQPASDDADQENDQDALVRHVHGVISTGKRELTSLHGPDLSNLGHLR